MHVNGLEEGGVGWRRQTSLEAGVRAETVRTKGQEMEYRNAERLVGCPSSLLSLPASSGHQFYSTNEQITAYVLHWEWSYAHYTHSNTHETQLRVASKCFLSPWDTWRLDLSL